MALPTVKVSLPSNLRGVSNGNLPNELLVAVSFPGRNGARLHYQAARSWYALADACQKATGATLTVTSSADAYRSFDFQLTALLTRYYPVSYATYLLTAKSKRRAYSYGGNKYWKLRDGMSPVATPGTSNHGLGIAIDVGVLLGSGNVVGIYGSIAWEWFYANVQKYGFSWEEQTEPWHIRLVTGDATPAIVVNFEHGGSSVPSPIPVFNPQAGQVGLWPLANKPNIGPGSQGDVVAYLQSVIYYKAGGGITIDGNYGPATAQRVKDLQGWFHATVDGWVGPETWHLIDTLAVQ